MLAHDNYLCINFVAEELKAKQQAKAAVPSRIPGARDANRKQAKYIPLDRTVPANCLAVDTNNIKYMVDPHGDVVEEGKLTNKPQLKLQILMLRADNFLYLGIVDDDSPMKIFDAVFNKYNQQFTTRWLGVTHLDHVPRYSSY